MKTKQDLDNERKNYLYLVSDLMEISRWLENYKECEGRTEVIRLIENETERLLKKSEELFIEIFKT